MSKKAYRWKGVWDEGAGGWQEFFGAESGDPLPTRDLTTDDVAGFTDLQKQHLDSPAGKRLYEAVHDGGDKSAKPTGSAAGQSDRAVSEAGVS